MRIAVLGATGLVGRHLVEALRSAGHRDLIATYRARPPYGSDGVEWRQADLMRPEEARAALKGAQAVLHCAGKLSTAAELRRDPIASVTDTLRIGVNVLEAAAAERVGRLVMLSSCTGYPEGMGVKEEPSMFAGVRIHRMPCDASRPVGPTTRTSTPGRGHPGDRSGLIFPSGCGPNMTGPPSVVP